MSKKTNNSELARSIIFASIVIAGSIVYYGMQYNNADISAESVNPGSISEEEFNEKVAEGIEAYIEKKEEEMNAPKVLEGDFVENDAILGDINAPVTIVEFSDFQCPYCVKFYNDTLPQLKEKYIDTGKVRFVYRDFPLSFHKAAVPAALISECAAEQGGDEVFFKMHDRVFDTILSGFSEDDLIAYAVELGSNEAKLRECMEDEEMEAEIYKDMADGQKAGISGTPGFVINGKLLTGAQPFSVFESIIEDELSNS